MTKPRRRPNATEKLAATLLMLKRGDEWLIPEPLRSAGSATEIVRAVDWHHEARFAIRPDHDPRMLTPLRPADHDARFGKDMAEISKFKRGMKARAGQKRRSRPMQYTAYKDTHKRDFRTGKAVPR